MGSIVNTKFSIAPSNSTLDTTLETYRYKVYEALRALKGAGLSTVADFESGSVDYAEVSGTVQTNKLTQVAVIPNAPVDETQPPAPEIYFEGNLTVKNGTLDGTLSSIHIVDYAADLDIVIEGSLRLNSIDMTKTLKVLDTGVGNGAGIRHLQLTEISTSKLIGIYGNFGSASNGGQAGVVTAVAYFDDTNAVVREELNSSLGNSQASLKAVDFATLVKNQPSIAYMDFWHGDLGKNLNDTYEGSSYDEYIGGGEGNDKLYGMGGYDSINGGAGNDLLVAGDDGSEMRGGSGNDKLTGGTGDDILDGGAGKDSLNGGQGNDTYILGLEPDTNKIDSAVEKADGGDDTVIASVSYTLAANFENLTLVDKGGAGCSGTGNKQDNIISGNNYSNVLNGKDGFDYLTGGGGADTFVFDTSFKPKLVDGYPEERNVDTIADFSSGDHIDISAKLVGGKAGVLQASDFVSEPGATAHDASDHFLYDHADGSLYYDPDGSGAKDAIRFAVLENLYDLTASQIHIV